MCALAAASVFWGRRLLPTPKNPALEKVVRLVPDVIDYTRHRLTRTKVFSAQASSSLQGRPVAIITSHHLPTAEDFIDSVYGQLKQSIPDAGRFVVVGPDHFERCKSLMTTSKKDLLTQLGPIKNDSGLTQMLMAAGAGMEDSCYVQEHSVAVQAVFIKKYFPDATVSPLLFSSAADMESVKKVAKQLAEISDVIVVCSTDFSHYESLQTANRTDRISERQLRGEEKGDLRLEQVDSPAAIKFVTEFTKARKAKLEVLQHANSFEFTGSVDNTTGYFNAIYTLAK